MSKVLSYEEKLELIRLWKEENYSIKMLSDHFGVAKSVVERWRKRYLIHGEKGLILRTTNPPYSEEQKEKILSEINNGISKRTILAKYKISHSTLSKWMLKSSNMEKFNPAKDPLYDLKLRKDYVTKAKSAAKDYFNQYNIAMDSAEFKEIQSMLDDLLTDFDL